MLRRITTSLLAAAFLLAGGPAVATLSGTAQAAPEKKAAKAKKTSRYKFVRVSRVKKPRRKVNFTSARRHAAQTRRATPRQQDKKNGVRVASLFGGLSGGLARRDGQIYANGRYLGKTIVPFKRKMKPGSILVKTRERALYFVLPGGKAEKYGVGVGREGFTWSGRHRITGKKKWPEWRPPEEMKKRELIKYGRKLPDVMPGGPENPLGARALYIGNTLYRIHGTNNPRSIGKFVSSGCIRMLNDEVSELYEKVKLGAQVVVED